MISPDDARRNLLDLLQRAYSGELAAAYAYRGHSNSVRNPSEKSEIKQIEDDEWHHRARLLEILTEMGGQPRRCLEIIFSIVGRTIALLCHLGGWFIPMYGAGKLERGNLVEYEMAARFAHLAGLHDYVEELLVFAEKELEHEQYFRNKALSHRLRNWISIWSAPPPRENIRTSFARFVSCPDFSEIHRDVFTINRVGRYRI